MKRPGFFKGVVVAAVFALAGSIAFAGLSILVGGAVALKIVTITLGGAYIVYLLHSASERIGRLAIFATWGVVTTATWLLTSDLSMTLITQCVLISTVRTLYHHASVLAGLLDFALSAFALSAAVWASDQSGSVFMTVWCFFLVQALFVGIPASFAQQELKTSAAKSAREDKFARAFRTAENAIRRIATQR